MRAVRVAMRSWVRAFASFGVAAALPALLFRG